MNKKILYTNKYQQPSWQGLGMNLLSQYGSGLINQHFQNKNPMSGAMNQMMSNTPSITGQGGNMMNFYQQPQQMPHPNMVQFQRYQEPGTGVNQMLEYIPNYPRTGGTEFGPGNFSALDYQNAITRDSVALTNYILNNPIKSWFAGSNQDHASSAGSLSGDIQLNREWLHKLKGLDKEQTREAAEKLNVYQQPGVAESPKKYIKLDENKYSLYKQPKRLYQVPDPSGSGQTGPYVAPPPTYGPQNDPNAGGGGSTGQSNLSGYANMLNFAANSFTDPTKNINTNPDANIQNVVYGPVDPNISTLDEDQPITFSENFKGGSSGINQLDYQDYQDIINGQVPADAGMGGAMMSGAQGAMAGAALGPVGAIAGFAIGTVGSMWKDSKNEEARQEIRESLTAQNQEAMNTGVVNTKQAIDNELARFLV